MMNENICDELLLLADKQLEDTLQLLPESSIERFILFIETIRVMDLYGVGGRMINKDKIISFQLMDIIRMGWNLGSTYLFDEIRENGFPLQESTDQTRDISINLLYRFGSVSLLRRVVDMIKTGFLTVEKGNNNFIFKKKTENMDIQFLDNLEFTQLKKLTEKINNWPETFYEGWKLEEYQNIENVRKQPGYYMSFRNDKAFSGYLHPDINSVMIPLIHQLETGRGTMLEYDSSKEIEDHFLAQAIELCKSWQNESGFHPESKLGNISGYEITAIALVLISLHLKHVHFAELAFKHNPSINIPQSLTIWQPLELIKNDIITQTGFSAEIVSEALDAIMMNINDIHSLRHHTSKFMPLLIDMGNGFVIRPVSSLVTNPFFSTIALLETRTPNNQNEISKPREAWLRNDLYALFEGTRYLRVEKNIKLREGINVITDIDAAIYDTLTGELALFQLKWQDFFFNDVRKLRSRASNLSKELEAWSEKTLAWIQTNGIDKLLKNLQLNALRKGNVSHVLLFGISKNAARMQGYGYTVNSPRLAISNWPQFVRNRSSIAPLQNVFMHMFCTLREQNDTKFSVKPVQTTLTVADMTMTFEDLWNMIEA